MKISGKGRRSRMISVLLAVMCVTTAITGCGQAEDEEEVMSEVIPVQIQVPEAGKLTLKNEFIGIVSPEESVYVVPMVSAEVLSTEISVGDTVEAGQVLCKLDSEAAELQLASAQAQYDSVAANVNAAQVGYEIAQAQYEGTVAQLDAQLGGQKNLQMYQLQIQVDTVQGGIDDIYEQLDDLAEDKEDAKDKKDELKSARNQATVYLQQAQKVYEMARDAVTALEPTDPNVLQEVIDQYGGQEAYKAALDNAKDQLASAKAAYEQAQEMASATESAYQQVKSGIESIEDGEEQLNNTLADTYKSLEQAEAIKNITEEQIYSDTQKVVDANKKTAALSIDSAAASVNAAQVGMEGAQVAVDSAEYQLDMYTLTAPISGVIEAVNVEAHDFASPGSPAFIISNKDTMMVTFYVSEGIRNTLTVGQKVQVDRNGKLYDAAITEIGSMIDQTTGLFAIKACVSAPDASLLTGSSVKVIADTYSQDNALLIPYDAVYYDASQPYVYVAVNGIVERRDIETGIFDEETITVLAGLTTEDQLITSWSANLREGAEISILTDQSTAEDTVTEDGSLEANSAAAQDSPEVTDAADDAVTAGEE
ncbi:MAG: efflux RND transporter periplasmic adaptor subunit [Lachnospiraceae bacterium]|nr:efflux RND transporter periplasmic adaptor subunit [Lachnospiraceae bacterium]